jgi:hypothetical protein
MYDDDAERREAEALLARYNASPTRPRLSAAVNAEFVRVAAARTQRHPLRTFVTRPLRRLYHLWAPVPEHELPMRVAPLGLPDRRGLFGYFDVALYLLALVGAAALARRGRRSPEMQLLALVALTIALRCLLYAYGVPLGATQRYIVELAPLLVVLAAVGGVALVESAARLRARA